jgi:uncharacterized protein (TIGR02466 family)
MNHTADLQNARVQNLFPTPLVIYALSDAPTLNAELKRVIHERRTTHPSVAKSNRKGWQSGDDFFNWAGAAGEQLRSTATSLVNQITKNYVPGDSSLAPFTGPWQLNGWANINPRGARNDIHSHAGCFWSGCYYVDTGSDGETADAPLELYDPRGTAPIMYAPTLRMTLKGCVSAGGVETYAPRAGEMVLFPSWLLHSVGEQMNDAERISVAFNFSV